MKYLDELNNVNNFSVPESDNQAATALDEQINMVEEEEDIELTAQARFRAESSLSGEFSSHNNLISYIRRRATSKFL